MAEIIIPVQTTARIYVKVNKPEELNFIDYEEYGKVKAKRTVIGRVCPIFPCRKIEKGVTNGC